MEFSGNNEGIKNEGDPKVLHVIDCVDEGPVALAALEMARFFNQKSSCKNHTIVSLLKPSSPGLRRAQGYGVDVDSGSGETFLSYHVRNADIVQVHLFNTPSIERFLRLNLGPKRLLIWNHRSGNQSPHFLNEWHKNCADVIVQSDTSCREPIFGQCSVLGSKVEEPCLNIPNTINLSNFNIPEKSEPAPFTMGFMGNIAPHMLSESVIAMNASDDFPECRVLFAGPGNFEFLQNQARLFKKSKRFEFSGLPASCESFLSQLDVFFYPVPANSDGTQDLYLQMAMSAGLPCIVFSHNGLMNMVVNDYSALIVHSDKEYQEAVLKLYKYPAERKRLGNNARSISKQIYGLENTGPRIDALYRKMLTSHKRDILKNKGHLTNEKCQQESGANLFILSFGQNGDVYRESRGASNFIEGLYCDLKIQEMSQATHFEGLQSYLNIYQDDPWLLFWSGLAFLGLGDPTRALCQLAKAKQKGIPAERIDYAIIQGSIKLKQWEIVHSLLRKLESKFVGAQLLNKIRQQLPPDLSTEKNIQTDSIGFSVLKKNVEEYLSKQDLQNAQIILQRLDGSHLISYRDDHIDWVFRTAMNLGLDAWVMQMTRWWLQNKSCPCSVLNSGAEAAWNAKDEQLFFEATQRILNEQTDHSATYRMIGRWHIRNYKFPEAAQSFAQSLQHNPEDITVLKLLAECFRVMGETDGERLTRKEIDRLKKTAQMANLPLVPKDYPTDLDTEILKSNQTVNMNDIIIKLQNLLDAQDNASAANYLASLPLENVARSQEFTAICELALKLRAFPWVLNCVQFISQQPETDVPTLRFCAEACVASDCLATLLELAPKVFCKSPDDPLMCRLIASMYLNKENYQETAGWLARAIKQDPDHLASLEVLAECFEHCGETEARNHTLERIQFVEKEGQRLTYTDSTTTTDKEITTSDTSCNDSDLSPLELLHAHDRLIRVQKALENQAFSWLREVADHAFGSIDCPLEIFQACCKACVELDDEAMLLKLAERVESQIPGDPITCRLVAAYHLKKDRYRSAAQFLARSLKHEPDHLMTLEVLAECFEHAGEQEAKEHTLKRINEVKGSLSNDDNVKKVETVAPGELMRCPDRSILIQSALENSQYSWLRAVADELTETEGCPVEMLQACCKACVELDDETMLLKLARRIEEVHPDDPICCRLVGAHYLKKNDFLTASSYLARSLKRQPEHLLTLEMLAECFEHAGELEARDHTIERIDFLKSQAQEVASDTSEDSNAQDGKLTLETESIQKKDDVSTPLVTAIVSTYCSEIYMRGCLDNLLRQTLGQRLEIIVIDSGSPEKEGRIVREYQRNHSNIRYIRTEKRETVYEAWNRGVNAARGKYVVNANTDDGHRKDAFESLAQCLEANPKASIAYGDIVYTTKANDTFPSEHVTRQIHYPEFHPGLAFACCFAGCTQFWRRDDLIRVGIFDASYKAAGDYEILLRAVQHGLSAVHIPEELSLHYFNENGITFGPETKQLSVDEAQRARQDYVNQLDIGALYNEPNASSERRADLWCDLSDFFYQYKAPWEMENPKSGIENLNFVVYCVKKALEENASHATAASNLIWLDRHFGQSNEASAYLLALGNTWNSHSLEELGRRCVEWEKVLLTQQPSDYTLESQTAAVTFSSQGDCQVPVTGQKLNCEKHQQSSKKVQGAPVCSFVGSLQEADQLFASGAYEKSWECTQEAILKRPFSPEGFFLLGKIALIAGDLEKAKICAERLCHMTPDWPHAKQLMDEIKVSEPCHPPRLGLSDIRCIGSGSRVSVCLIAKDEETQIGACLDSVSEFAYEVILVDTGSTDRTVAIAEAKGARVIHHPWRDDFSDARNVSLEHATGDWVFIIDADERINSEDIGILQNELKQPGILNYRLPIRNHGAKEYGHGYVPRLYRNAPGLCYIGRIHEQIYYTTEMLRKRWCMRGTLGETPIQHYGYREEIVLAKDKRKRNLKLLERAISETPDEANYRYNYALELRNVGRGQEALDHYQKAIDLLKTLPDEDQVAEFTHALTQQYGSVLLEEKKHQKVAEIAEDPWIQRHVSSASWSLVQGIAFAELNEYEKAIDALDDCIARRHKPVLSPGIIEVQSGLPAFLKGKIHHQLEQEDMASESFALAVQDSPENIDYLLDYAAWLHAHSKSLEAVQLLHRQMPHGVNDTRYWQLGAKISKTTSGFESFYLDWTTEAIKYQPNDTQLQFAHLESLMLSNHWSRAANMSSEFLLEPQSAEHWGIHYLLCLYHGMMPKGLKMVEEQNVSRYFVAGYRRLVQLGG